MARFRIFYAEHGPAGEDSLSAAPTDGFEPAEDDDAESEWEESYDAHNAAAARIFLRPDLSPLEAGDRLGLAVEADERKRRERREQRRPAFAAEQLLVASLRLPRLDLVLAQAACLGHAGRLQRRICQTDMRIQPARRRRHGIRGNRVGIFSPRAVCQTAA